MRIIANDDGIDISYDKNAGNEITDFLNKHKGKRIHVLLLGSQGTACDEKIIHDNLEIFKKFSECNVTFEYEEKLEYKGFPIYMEEYLDKHDADGKRISGKNKVFSIKKIIEDEEFIMNIANEINNSGFSQLEKTFAIYNMTTSIKRYLNEGREYDGEASRSLFEYLNNSFMVCAGYVNFMENLCYLTGIPTFHESVETKGGERHARLYTNICDEKYGIDGYYVMDPTNDSNIRIEFRSRSFKHFLMTTLDSFEDIENSDFEVIEDILSYKDTEDFKNKFNKSDKSWLEYVFEKLDKNFAQIFQALDLEKDEDINILLDYLHRKIDNKVEEKTIKKIKVAYASKVFERSEEDIEKLVTPMSQQEKDMLEELKVKKELQELGYIEESTDSLLDRLKFVYDVMYKSAIEDYKSGNIYIFDDDMGTILGTIPKGEKYNNAQKIAKLLEKKLNRELREAEDSQKMISELEKMGFSINEQGKIDSDEKWEQMLEMAEKQAELEKQQEINDKSNEMDNLKVSYGKKRVEPADLKKAQKQVEATINPEQNQNQPKIE